MCDKCNDIHTAQKEGKQDKPCSCVCHPMTNIPAPNWQVIETCTCGWATTQICPIHGNNLQWTFTTGSGCNSYAGI